MTKTLFQRSMAIKLQPKITMYFILDGIDTLVAILATLSYMTKILFQRSMGIKFIPKITMY